MRTSPASDRKGKGLARKMASGVEALAGDAVSKDGAGEQIHDRVAPAERRWGFMEDGHFVPVPKIPIELAVGRDARPPFTFTILGTERVIFEEEQDVLVDEGGQDDEGISSGAGESTSEDRAEQG
jgi:hypothetical protein